MKKRLKNFKKEIKTYEKCVKNVSLIFKSKTEKTAIKRYNKMKDKIKDLPNIIADFIKKLFKNFHRTIKHTQHKPLPSTNNNIESYFGTTIYKELKRKYQTIQGLKLRSILSKIRWNQQVVLKIK